MWIIRVGYRYRDRGFGGGYSFGFSIVEIGLEEK